MADAPFVIDSFEPTVDLKVSFYAPGGADVQEGAQLSVKQVSLPPSLSISGAAPETLFTVLLTDPDAPSVEDPKFGEFAHWVAVNATAADVLGSCETIVAYHGSSPGPGSGLHRYCLVLYAQPGRIACDEPRVGPTSGFPPRRHFKQKSFAGKYGLTPVAFRTYRCEFDAVWQPLMAAKVQGLAPPA